VRLTNINRMTHWLVGYRPIPTAPMFEVNDPNNWDVAETPEREHYEPIGDEE
jgi:hypothetical protein